METRSELQHYRYRGARALLLLHEEALRHFVEVWRQAKAANLKLPESRAAAYQSLEMLLRHALRVPQMNMQWICEQLGLPDPGLAELPPNETLAQDIDRYLNPLLAGLREPLADVEPERFFRPTFATRWKQDYTIESMLEHFVTHAMRHRLQLQELLAAQAG